MGTWSLNPWWKVISWGFDDTTAPPNVIGLVNHSRNLRTVEGAIWPGNWYVNLILKSESCFAWENHGELAHQATKKGDAPSLNSNCTVKRCAERHATLSAEDPSAPIWSCTWIIEHWGRWPLMFKMVETDTVMKYTMPYRAHAKYMLLWRVAFKPFPHRPHPPSPTQRLRIGPCAQQLSLVTFTFTQRYQQKCWWQTGMISWFNIYQYVISINTRLIDKTIEMAYHFILWTLFAEIIPQKYSFFQIRIVSGADVRFWESTHWPSMVIYFIVAAAYPRSGQTHY